MSKAGRVAEAYRTIKNLPELMDDGKRRKASKFEKGLAAFVNRNMRKSFEAFK
jgi:hypothetical protein